MSITNLNEYVWIVVIVSAIWVYMDARELGAGTYDLGGWADAQPWRWAVSVLLLWLIMFPLYLLTRPKLVVAASPPPPEERRCSTCDRPYPAEYDGCPHCAKTAGASA